MKIIVDGYQGYTNTDYVHNVMCHLDATLGPITAVLTDGNSPAAIEAGIWAETMVDCGKSILIDPVPSNFADPDKTMPELLLFFSYAEDYHAEDYPEHDLPPLVARAANSGIYVLYLDGGKEDFDQMQEYEDVRNLEQYRAERRKQQAVPWV